MGEIPQSVRFTANDKLDNIYLHSRQAGIITSGQIEAARMVAANADCNTARELIGIKDAAHEIERSQIEAAYIISRSIGESSDKQIDHLNRNTDRIVEGLDQIYEGINELKAAFDWKLSEMIWIAEQQRDYLKEILEVMKRPRLTQAIELREEAMKNYRKNWIDEALDDFMKAKSLNPTDFTIHQSLGNIFLFHKKDPEKALEYYMNASKYAIDYPYYNSYALLHVGLANYVLGHYRAAYYATKEAIEKYPDFSEAYYQHAKCCSRLGMHTEALSNLRIAIDADRRYCAKALTEEDFMSMSGQLKRFFEVLIEKTKSKADSEIEKSINLIEKFNTQNIGQVCHSLDPPYRDITKDAKSKLEEGLNLKTKGTYFNYKDAIYKAYTSQKMVIDSLIQYLSDQESEIKSKYKDKKNPYEKKQSKKGQRAVDRSNSILYSIILIAISFLLGDTTWNNGGSIVRNSLIIDFTGIHATWSNVTFKIGDLFLMGLFFLGLAFLFQINEKNIDNKIKHIGDNFNEMMELFNKDIAMAKLEKDKLNIDKEAEKLSPREYESYLLKNYG